MPLFSKQSGAFGLDVSNLSLKIVKLEQAGSAMKLACFSESAIPAGVIVDAKVADEDGLSHIIKEAIVKAKGEKLKTRKIVASLPEEKSFIDVFQIPQVKKETLSVK